MNFLFSSDPDVNLKTLEKELGQNIACTQIEQWNFYSTEELGFQNSEFFSHTEGYIKDLNLSPENSIEQEISCGNIIENVWPVPSNITGSFSRFQLNLSSDLVCICTDPIGVYPLYYLKLKGQLYISNSLIWLGAIQGVEIDETGVFQRCFGPEYCNFGRRTILKNCSRLLPGEWLQLDHQGNFIKNKYDNTLYNSHSSPDSSKKTAAYWKALKKEVEYCLSNEKTVNLALSGGMDSRILLGAVSFNKKLRCLTYGNEKDYEVKIASKLARIKGAEFRSFHYPYINFPSREILREYNLKTEGIYLCSWLEILENVSQTNEPLLIGDLSTAATGRSIKRFNSKTYQKKNFLKHNLLNKGHDFEKNNSASFKSWKDRILNRFLRSYTNENIHNLGLSIELSDLREKTREDLSALFDRIASHDLAYIELVDELFTWYTHTRFPMGKQVLLNRSKFQTFCPALSIQIMRLISSVAPESRLNLGFVQKLFKEEKELQKLSRIPTNQVPLLPLNAPHIFRLPMWGFRKIMDDYFIKKLVKAKDPKKRYRLFKSNNWVKIYQQDNLDKKLDAYFTPNYLGQAFADHIKKQAIKRKSLEFWPFANMNIMNAAGLNDELEHIHKLGINNEI